MHVYRTYFNLDYPVLDIEEAQNYLTNQNMTKCLKENSNIVE